MCSPPYSTLIKNDFHANDPSTLDNDVVIQSLLRVRRIMTRRNHGDVDEHDFSNVKDTLGEALAICEDEEVQEDGIKYENQQVCSLQPPLSDDHFSSPNIAAQKENDTMSTTVPPLRPHEPTWLQDDDLPNIFLPGALFVPKKRRKCQEAIPPPIETRKETNATAPSGEQLLKAFQDLQRTNQPSSKTSGVFEIPFAPLLPYAPTLLSCSQEQNNHSSATTITATNTATPTNTKKTHLYQRSENLFSMVSYPNRIRTSTI